jgi:hypothetical protein
MLARWVCPAFGLGLALAVLLVAADAWRRLQVAMVLTDSGANPPREVVRAAELNGVYIIGLVVGGVTAILAVIVGVLFYLSVKAPRRGRRSAVTAADPARRDLL